MKKNITLEKLQDRSSIHMVCVLISGTASFTSSLILGRIILDIPIWEYFSRLGEGVEIYQQIMIMLIQIGLSGFIIFVTPIFFSTILSIIPSQKMLISPYYGQMIVFCVSILYFYMNYFSVHQVTPENILLIPGIGGYLMFASFFQHEIVKKLVGVELENFRQYSLKVNNSSKEQILEVLMHPETRRALNLTEKIEKTEMSMRLSSKKRITNLRIEIRKVIEDELFINIIFYTTGKNSIIDNDLEPQSRMKFLYLKEELEKSKYKISFKEVKAEENTQFLLESINNDYDGSYKELYESIKTSILKIILFVLGIVLIGVLFWTEQTESGTFASLSVILYIVFKVRLYTRRKNSRVRV